MRLHLFFIFFLLFIAGCSTTQKPETILSQESLSKEEQLRKKEEPKKLIPIKDPHHVLLDHKHFQIGYDKKYRLPRYVKYTVTREQLSSKIAKRKDKFIPDPLLQKLNLPVVTSKDYSRSGYDRGHMAPAADFSYSQEATDKTFVMTNMAPQKGHLNRNAWKNLEDQVRKWGCGEEKITVITGPILQDDLPTLKSGIPVPHEFYKVVIDETPPKKIISFIYNQNDKTVSYKERIVELNKVLVKAKLTPDLFIESGVRTISSIDEWKEAPCR